jgi:GT2 family glycosyltransferase
VIPDLVISIVNHSNPQMLRDCIASVYASTHHISFDIWVIDNATDQRLVSDIQAEFPQVRWLFNSARRGFSANHNQMLAVAEARYLCILNDDTIVHDGALAELVRFMDIQPQVGMTGPRLLNRDGSIQNSTFREKSLLGELIDILQIPSAVGRLKLHGIDPAQFSDESAPVDWLLGACLMIRKQTLDQIGLLDDVMSPIANCEEVDWCHRVRKAGWQVCYLPAAAITHFGGQSLKADSPGADRFRVEMHRVTLAYFRKQRGWAASLILRAIFIVSLPWNGLMLVQSVLRGRTQAGDAKSHWATLVGIAIMATKPMRRPYCRPDTSPLTGPRRPHPDQRSTGVPIGT